MRVYTWILTLFAVALCFLHYFNLDPKNMLLYSLSVPLWFLHAFGDIRTLNLIFVYALTIVFYALLGYVIDRFIQRQRETHG